MSYQQTFHGDIGRLINNEQFFRIGLGLEATKLPQHLVHCASLLDRKRQLNKCVDVISERIRLGTEHDPLVFVLRGEIDDLHPAFVQRMERHELLDSSLLAAYGPYHVHRPIRGWVWEPGTHVEEALRLLGECAGLPRHSSRAQIEEFFASSSTSISFSFTLRPKSLKKDYHDDILSWINYILTNWPRQAAPRLCVAFVCIEHDADGETKGVRMAVDRLFELSRKQRNLVILEPFEPVRDTDVLDWAGLVAERFPTEIYDPLSLIVGSKLYSRDRKPKRLGRIYGDVLKLLLAAYRPPSIKFEV